MDNNPKNLSDAAAMAQFRLALIAPVIHGLYPDASRNAYYQRITEKPLTLPDGSVFQYSPKTLSKWVSLYQNGGIDALMPQERSDKGSTRVLPDTAIEEIYRIKEAFPRLNATQIHKHLVEAAFIPAAVSVCAVQRFVKNHDLKSARNPSMRDRKAFEEDAFGKMWQADTCYLPYITEDGQRRRVYCIMIIDDHSRFLVGGGLFYNDNAYNFQKVLKDAVAAHGIPAKLYVDNGCSYSNEQLSPICGSIGTVLLHTKIRDGASKAKIERQFRTLKETWLYTLDLDSITSLAQFNGLLKDYMRTYNTSVHSGIGTTPMERYQQTRSSIRSPKSGEWLEECFLNRITRKVGKDSTVSIDRVSYDVPMQFISSKVEIRFLPDDMSSAFILYEGAHYPIRPTDRNENCRTKRNNTPSIDYSRIGGGGLMFRSYYGLSFNPFDKQNAKEKDRFLSKDISEMTSRLDYLKDTRGIGLFTARPGMGKSFALRCFAKSLNPNLYHMEYICLSTVSVMEFYRQLCSVLGVEPRGGKPGMFRAVQEQILYLYKDKKQPLLLAVDEAQYLSTGILEDIKMLMNYGYDSLNCFTLILCGEPHLNNTLKKPVHEALRQRITVHYNFSGLSDSEVAQYILHKIACAGGAASIIDQAALSAVHSHSQGSPRLVDNLMTDALTLGAQMEKKVIDTDVILASVSSQNLG